MKEKAEKNGKEKMNSRSRKTNLGEEKLEELHKQKRKIGRQRGKGNNGGQQGDDRRQGKRQQKS